MNPNRIMMINGILFCVIITVSVIIMRQERQAPGEPPLREIQQAVAAKLTADSGDQAGPSAELPNFGAKNIFDTLIPRLTPTPQPPKTPVPPPRIDEVTDGWRLSGPLSTFASFQDIKTREDFILKIGETRDEKYKGQTVKITLESTEKLKSATIMMNMDGEVQRRKLTMVP
ncbi:hypothetical protein BH09SUM1_BH09SUM1_24330 [soil metagenome]